MSISKNLFKKLFFLAFLLCFALICMVNAGAAYEGGGKVNASCLNFRAEPSTSSETLALAYEGDQVVIIGSEGDWYNVILNGVYGYMFSEYVTPIDTIEFDPVSARVTGNSVRLRDDYGLKAEIICHLDEGTPLKVSGVTGCWFKVTYGETEGYMHNDYVELYYSESDHYTPGQQIIEYAKQFLDVPYVYGASSGKAFDCSGFTSYVLKKNGYDSTRTCTSQYAQYTHIERSELRIGDLVFFASASSWDTNHVGLYMGDNLFIHASSGRGKVVISSLDETYYDKYYYGAARYLPN